MNQHQRFNLTRAVEHLERHPEDRSLCWEHDGCSGSLAGWICYLAGAAIDSPGRGSRTHSLCRWNGERYTTSRLAAQLTGLRAWELYWLSRHARDVREMSTTAGRLMEDLALSADPRATMRHADHTWWTIGSKMMCAAHRRSSVHVTPTGTYVVTDHDTTQSAYAYAAGYADTHHLIAHHNAPAWSAS